MSDVEPNSLESNANMSANDRSSVTNCVRGVHSPGLAVLVVLLQIHSPSDPLFLLQIDGK